MSTLANDRDLRVKLMQSHYKCVLLLHIKLKNRVAKYIDNNRLKLSWRYYKVWDFPFNDL